MRKKVTALVLTSAMAVSLAACGGGNSTATTAAPAADAPAADTPAPDSPAAEPSGDGLVYWSLW